MKDTFSKGPLGTEILMETHRYNFNSSYNDYNPFTKNKKHLFYYYFFQFEWKLKGMLALII